jgi:hypothetical protein
LGPRGVFQIQRLGALVLEGAVHIDDVATAVILSLDLLSRQQLDQQLVLTLDSAYEYTDADLAHWDADGPARPSEILFRILGSGAILRARSGIKANQARYFRDGSLAGYEPAYSLANLLSELATFGVIGPPHFSGSNEAHAPLQ